MRKLAPDIRYALRQFRRNPGFTVMAVLTLALGIGATTAIFSLMNAVLLRPLPVQKPQELLLLGDGVQLGVNEAFPHGATTLFSNLFYRELQQKNQVFSGVAAMQSLPSDTYATIGNSNTNEPVSARLVSGSFFSVLGVNPTLGRMLTDGDDRVAGASPFVVASYAWWNRRFDRDSSIIGKQLTIGSTTYTIVGVAAPEFFGTTVGESPNLWIPLSMQAQLQPGLNGLQDKMFQDLYLMGRMKPGISGAQVAVNTNLVFKQILHEYAGAAPDQSRLQEIQHAQISLTSMATGLSRLRIRVSMPLQILMGAVGLVLLIACANLATMLLARAASREREIAVRMAVGAARSRLIRQLLSESLVLSSMGGALGVVFAWWASHVLLKMVAAGLGPLYLDLNLDFYVLGFALLVSVGTALLFGLAPAFRTTRIELVPSLKEGKGASSPAGRAPLGKVLVVSQIALSLVLLAGATLFVRTLVNLARVNPGFDKDNTLIFHLDTPASGQEARTPAIHNLYRQIEQRVQSVPGVSAASFTMLAFGEGAWKTPSSAPGYVPGSEGEAWVHDNLIGANYFAATGIPLLTGRTVGSQDTENSPRVAVINQTMARRFFGNESPLGKHFSMGDPRDPRDVEVIGVVGNSKYEAMDEPPFAAAYFPYTQYHHYGGGSGYLFDLMVHYSGNSESIANEVRRAVAAVNRNVAVSDVVSVNELIERSVVPQSLIAQLSSFFGVLAVLLACIGIYGLMSYAVNRRTSEIGIRLALGADRANVRWMVMREVLLLVGIGLAIGVPAALATDRLVASLLFGLTPTDLVSIFAAIGLTLIVAAIAGYIPARRATRIDPMVALRYE
jgi:predicted permease